MRNEEEVSQEDTKAHGGGCWGTGRNVHGLGGKTVQWPKSGTHLVYFRNKE